MEAMKSFCAKLMNRMEGELLHVRLEYPTAVKWSQQSIPYLKSCLDELKSYLLAHPFKKRSEEIYFFKYIKPVIMGRMIFMCEVYNTETLRPVHHSADDNDFLINEVDEIEHYFGRYNYLYNYYKNDLDELDTKFFVRNVEDRFTKRHMAIEIDPIFFYGDTGFSTGFDYAFAKIRGLELLRDHLEIEFEASSIAGDEVPEETIQFTGTGADFLAMIDLFKRVGRPVNPETGKPATGEEIFQLFFKGLNPDLPADMDLETLKLISGDSDLPQRMLDALEKLHSEWDEEDKDVDYDDDVESKD